MCDEGRLGFHYLESDKRLTEPMIKEGGKHCPADWPEAVRKAAEGLSKFRGDELAIIASGRMTNEELYLVRTLADTLEAGTVDIIRREGEADDYLVHADKNPNTAGAKAILKLRSPGSKTKSIIKGVENGSIKALLVLGENLQKAGFEDSTLKKLKLLVSSHILANPTAKLSHVVLPGAGFAEKRGSMVNATGRLQRLNKALEPPGDARDDWETLQDLNRAVDGLDGLYDIADVFVEMAANVPAFKSMTLSKIGDLGVDLIESEEAVPLLERERERVAQRLIVG
jgi:NADH-quinone oxidoreductase subunit G